jgi:four helix bundle protein
MTSYKELKVWQKSIVLCKDVYQLTESFPQKEIFGLTSQMRRCSISIPSNIAEGQRRGSNKEFSQFLRISFGSGAELETQLYISMEVGYISNNQFQETNIKLEEIMKMLNKLIQSLQQS